MPEITTITDPTGYAWVLDGSYGVWEGRGRAGFHGTSYQHYRTDSPAVAGSFWNGVRALSKELLVPIVIRDPNRDVALAKRRQFAQSISPVNGDGLCTITSAWPDGSVRSIDCRYIDGLEAGAQGPGEYGITTFKYNIRFMADDPYFYGPAIAASYSLATSSRTELPIPGTDTFYEVVTSPFIGGGITVFNAGDVAAYPTWQFNGPYTQIVAQNATTGKTWTITYTAATNSDLLVVSTSPANTYIIDEFGINQWSSLTAGNQLWPLARGTNIININVIGADATSTATLSYVPLYEGD